MSSTIHRRPSRFAMAPTAHPPSHVRPAPIPRQSILHPTPNAHDTRPPNAPTSKPLRTPAPRQGILLHPLSTHRETETGRLHHTLCLLKLHANTRFPICRLMNTIDNTNKHDIPLFPRDRSPHSAASYLRAPPNLNLPRRHTHLGIQTPRSTLAAPLQLPGPSSGHPRARSFATTQLPLSFDAVCRHRDVCRHSGGGLRYTDTGR